MVELIEWATDNGGSPSDVGRLKLYFLGAVEKKTTLLVVAASVAIQISVFAYCSISISKVRGKSLTTW